MSRHYIIDSELHLTNDQLFPVLKCFAHTLLFHRFLSVVEPVDEYDDMLGFSYAKCKMPKLDTLIESRVNRVIGVLKKVKADTVLFSFFTWVQKAGLFSSSLEVAANSWEVWEFGIRVVDDVDGMSETELAQAVREKLFNVIDLMYENISTVPDLRQGQVTPYPFSIKLKDTSLSGGFNIFSSSNNICFIK
eukprot:TRINITY_DN1904_c0_g1_i1.p1 TRINITY_DN1904_c0_g1~~TRINITY_DN1904_c0_g1_i1.p1  ORF type:complete len:191 (-),score=25.10 TRINITY_DN1904_c0_g1_i1:37-609(-)